MSTIAESEKNEESYFFPPLYRQRYLKICDLIQEHKKCYPLKIVDIGCSEMNLFPYLRRIKGITEIILMDIDHEVLKDKCNKINPFVSDNLQKRETPLCVTVVCADAKQAHYPTLNADIVTMVELIEHLQEEELPPLMKNVLGVIRPEKVILTTPNSNYNKYFSTLPAGKFRHFDHKFEWTKEEFETWCQVITQSYPLYTVTFSGCGEGPDKVNFCSQIAIFNKEDTSELENLETKLEHSLQIKSTNENDEQASVTKACEGCLTSQRCNVVHTVTYPIEDRSEEEKYRDTVSAHLVSLRLWLKRCLSYWDCYKEPELEKGKQKSDNEEEGDYTENETQEPCTETQKVGSMLENQNMETDIRILSEQTGIANQNEKSNIENQKDSLPSQKGNISTKNQKKCSNKPSELAEILIKESLQIERLLPADKKYSDLNKELMATVDAGRVLSASSSPISSCSLICTSSSVESLLSPQIEEKEVLFPNQESSAKDGDGRCWERERFKFENVSDLKSLLQVDPSSMEDVFFYSEDGDNFMFTINTFCAWANLDQRSNIINELSKERPGMSLEETNSDPLIRITFENDDSDEEYYY